MNKQEIIVKTVEVLNAGGVIIYPTDTIWGIGCDATNPQAIDKVYRIKHRDPVKSMLILCSDFEQVRQYVEDYNPSVQAFLETKKRPTTVVYPQARNLPENLLAADGSIGIRVPKSEFCQQLLTKFGKPIVSTSANFSGKKPPANFFELDALLVETVDFIVPDEFCDSQFSYSSQVVKIEKNGEIVVLR
ncbi:MAG: threonylcarbamoyl-AMP synthase [Bacteroidales bacterium]|nr:threonylcarbamoyl-AMP synthase [Bacteroidales bacterium]MBR5028090.1 threonylcarbamoyl-AMP synthase [Bacteroidales bacterium]